ncbi:MAG: metal-dependent hydrolase [Terriglobales bacterium]
MSPVTHFFTGWVFANFASLARRDRALVTLACVVPDVDGLGIVPEYLTRHSQHPLEWFSTYHHSLHTLPFAIVVAALSFALATERWKTAGLAFLSFHIHLFEDLLGSRGPEGYQWPIPYLMPFSRACALSWRGQWALNAWPNFAITIALLLATFYLAWSRGFSPLEMVSLKADAAFVEALRKRIPGFTSRPSGTHQP